MNKFLQLTRLLFTLSLLAICISCDMSSADIEALSQFEVSFETNGGSPIPLQMVERNSKAIRPDNPTREESIFVGWYADPSYKEAWDFTALVTENTTLYAKWTINQYSVTFDTNEGSTINKQNVDYNTTATQPTAPTRTGYTFGGWYSNSALTSEWNFNTKITTNMTLYAKWGIDSYIVTFESNGGSNVSSQTITYNTTIEKPTEPTRGGYTFIGWFSNSALTSEWNFSTAVTANITLYAKWISTSGTLPETGVEDLF